MCFTFNIFFFVFIGLFGNYKLNFSLFTVKNILKKLKILIHKLFKKNDYKVIKFDFL